MGIQNVRQFAGAVKNNLGGWSTNRKIVVIESDDWGSIRMPSKDVYNSCLKAGYAVNLNPFERFDSLASKDDLELLFDMLTTFKDKNGRHPVITANSVVANPDFDKIKRSNFTQYYFQRIEDTFSEYPNHKNNLDLWKSGTSEGIFYPQYHGREHLNVSLFMLHLQLRNSDTLFGFNHKMPGSIQLRNPNEGNIYVEATNALSEDDKQNKKAIILEGLQMFEELNGYKSESYIPTNYIISPEWFPELFANGVKYMQGGKVQFEPDLEGGFIKHKRFNGEMDNSGLLFLMRNCSFEPSITQQSDDVDKCLRAIQVAFLLKKPAVINSHRINYVGYIDPKNRDKNLMSLKLLLTKILKRWPDVEFVNSVELGDLINDKNK